MKDEDFIRVVEEAIIATNKNGKCCPSNAAKIQKFTILPRDFSVITGDFTATLKLKRSVVEAKHKETLDAMYESKDTYVPWKGDWSTVDDAANAEAAEEEAAAAGSK